MLATGPGTNTVVVSTRGHTFVFMAYLVRIITASLLVSYVTLNVVRGNQELASHNIRSLKDLAGQRVAVRPGTVSDDLLQRLNDSGLQPPIQLRELDQVIRADSLLAADAVDAVLADDIQLDFCCSNCPTSSTGWRCATSTPNPRHSPSHQASAKTWKPGSMKRLAGSSAMA